MSQIMNISERRGKLECIPYEVQDHWDLLPALNGRCKTLKNINENTTTKTEKYDYKYATFLLKVRSKGGLVVMVGVKPRETNIKSRRL